MFFHFALNVKQKEKSLQFKKRDNEKNKKQRKGRDRRDRQIVTVRVRNELTLSIRAGN